VLLTSSTPIATYEFSMHVATVVVPVATMVMPVVIVVMSIATNY
jgi:hypothetical protein